MRGMGLWGGMELCVRYGPLGRYGHPHPVWPSAPSIAAYRNITIQKILLDKKYYSTDPNSKQHKYYITNEGTEHSTATDILSEVTDILSVVESMQERFCNKSLAGCDLV